MRLAASLTDLNNHISGNNSHAATNISTNVVVGGVAQTNVGGALSSLDTRITSVAAGPSSTSALGTIKLAQDLSGTALLPTVVGILGYPVVAPGGVSSGMTLTFDATLSRWTMEIPTFTGDIVNFGGGPDQYVSKITGNPASSPGSTITTEKGFIYNLQEGDFILKQTDLNSNSIIPGNIVITGKSINAGFTNTTYPAGDISLIPGTGGSGANRKDGSIRLSNTVQIVKPVGGTQHMNILGGTTQYSSGSGIFNTSFGGTNIIGNISSDPVTSTTHGGILYSVSGRLKYINNDISGVPRFIGTPENPEIWRDTSDNNNGGVYKERFIKTSGVNTAATFTNIPVNSTFIFSTARPLHIVANLKCGAITNDGTHTYLFERTFNIKVLSPNAITIVDATAATIAGTGTWIAPTITQSGVNLIISGTGNSTLASKSQYILELRQA